MPATKHFYADVVPALLRALLQGDDVQEQLDALAVVCQVLEVPKPRNVCKQILAKNPATRVGRQGVTLVLSTQGANVAKNGCETPAAFDEATPHVSILVVQKGFNRLWPA